MRDVLLRSAFRTSKRWLTCVGFRLSAASMASGSGNTDCADSEVAVTAAASPTIRIARCARLVKSTLFAILGNDLREPLIMSRSL